MALALVGFIGFHYLNYGDDVIQKMFQFFMRHLLKAFFVY